MNLNNMTLNNIINIKTETFKESGKPFLNITLILDNGYEINIPKFEITGLEIYNDLFSTKVTLGSRILSKDILTEKLIEIKNLNVEEEEEEEEDWKKCYEQYLSENEVK